MGGHGVHINYNDNAIQETDEAMQTRIQRIDVIKFNPWHFHLQALNLNNWYTVAGGAPTVAFGAIGAGFSYSYFASQSRPY